MAKKQWSLLVCVILSLLCGCTNEPPAIVIFDTDLSSDVDDVGAIAVLHSLALEDDVDIIAMMISSADPWSVSCLRALNRFFEAPEIPVGQTTAATAVMDESKYTEKIAIEFGSGTKNDKPVLDAVLLYREVLSAQEDNSVTVVSVGYFTNLANLLESGPDSVSPLTGVELVAQKVKRLVSMGGQYPKGKEWNFYRDVPSTKNVIDNWPTPIIFCGYEVGKGILTGKELEKTDPGNPVRRSYELYNGLSDRPSWDQATVYFAVKNSPGYFGSSYYSLLGGENKIFDDGSNQWVSKKDGDRYYIKLNVSALEIKKLIDDRMVSVVKDVM